MDFMRQYIKDFAEFKAASKSGDELKMKMEKKYPRFALENLLYGAVARAFPEKQNRQSRIAATECSPTRSVGR